LAHFIGEPSTDFCSDFSVLKKYRALEILPAVQPGPQNEMAIEQSPGFAEKSEEVFAHDFEARFGETPLVNLASNTDALRLRIIVDPYPEVS
jgi:hypothetical protein